MNLQHGRLWVAEEDGGDVLHDVGTDVEEVPLVLDRDESAFRASVLGDVQWA
jgi:hypothetical protein